MQVLSNVQDTEPLTRNAAIRTLAEQKGGIALDDASTHVPLCMHYHNGVAMSSDQSAHISSQLQALCDQAAGDLSGASALASRDFSMRGLGARARSLATGGRDPSQRGAAAASSGHDKSMSGRGALPDASAHGPMVLDRALDRAPPGLMHVLNQGSGVELWWENR